MKSNTTLKLTATLTLLFVILFGGLQAQTIYGLKTDPPFSPSNPSASTTYLSTIDPVTGASSMEIPIPSVRSSVYGSLAFDHERQAYVFWGADTLGDYRFYSIKVDSSGIQSPLVPNIPNIGIKGPVGVEYDLSTGICYGIIGVSQGPSNSISYFVSIDLITGNVVVINSFTTILGPVNLASTFDSNHHLYIFQGRDANQNFFLYYLDANTGQIVKQVPVLTPEVANDRVYAHFEYDNNTDQLFGVYGTIDQNTPVPYYGETFICEIDTGTGAITNLTPNPILQGVGIGSALFTNAYDQENRDYMFVLAEPGQNFKLKFYNMDSASFTVNTSYDTEVKQLLIDNHAFGVSRYGLGSTVGVSDVVRPQFSVYPNPIQDEVNVSWEQMQPDQIVVMDMHGRTVLSRSVEVGAERSVLDVHSLSQATYFLVLYENGNLKGVTKILKQEGR